MFQNRPARLLWHGEFDIPTGFGNVSREIVTRLHNLKTDWGTKKFDIGVMALGRGLDPMNPNNPYPFPVFPQYGDRGRAPFGQDYAADMVRRFKPDIIVTFGDTWMLDFWNDTNVIPEDLRKTFKLVAYVAIDGYPVPDFWIDKYKRFDKVITFTKFGKNAIDERAKELGNVLNSYYIYHGVNPQHFRPLPQADIENFKASRNLQGKKIVGMFSRNQPRKHHPEFIEFAVSLLDKMNNDPNLLFYFHACEKDAGWDLQALIRDIDRLKLRDRFKLHGNVHPGQEIPEGKVSLLGRFIFAGLPNPTVGYPVEMLNYMYNMCDAHFLATSGEGWGMTISESLSAGVPTFTNDYAAGAELIVESKGGELIKARDFTYRGSDHNFFRPHTDYNDAADKVSRVLLDPDLKKKYSKKARAFGLSLSWDIIIEDWNRELSNLYELPEGFVQRTESI